MLLLLLAGPLLLLDLLIRVLVWLHIKLWGGYPPCSGIKNPSSEHLFLKGEKDMWKALL